MNGFEDDDDEPEEVADVPIQGPIRHLPRPDPSARFWSIEQTAAYLELGTSTVRRLISSRKLACLRVGPNDGRIRVEPAAVEEYLTRCRCEAKAKPSPTPLVPKSAKTRPAIAEPGEMTEWERLKKGLYR